MKIWKPAFSREFIPAVLAFVSVGTVIFAPGSVSATIYGENITKYDGVNQVGTKVAIGVGQGLEDNEAEPGMVQSQAWDLEGFFLNGTRTSLTIVGGYNFYTGKDGMDAGDIFIDTDGNVVVSPEIIPGITTNYQAIYNSSVGYEYVLDINWVAGTFDIVQLNDNASFSVGAYGDDYNVPSNPWIYLSGGTDIGGGSFNTYNKGSHQGGDTGLLGWSGDYRHYAATFNISGINLSNGALFHNTMECGNDNLIGQVAPVPEPATMLLLGTGLAGLLGLRRRKKA